MKQKHFNEIVTLHRGYDLPSDDREEGTYPLFSSNGLTDHISSFKIKGPGVVTGRSGTIGNVFYSNDDFWPLNTTLYVSDFHGNNPKYIQYWLSSFPLKNFASGASVPTLNRNELIGVFCKVHSLNEQQHIVDTIGSVDSLIELNQEKISKIKRLATQKYEFLYKAYPKSAIGKKLKFIKGKQPKFASKEDGLPYLVIDDLASNIYTHFSSEGLACDENDVLMVMDGASSGKVFTGNKGYVGSTLAKLSSPQIKPSILYFGLAKFEEEIMKNTTGSAIPHTDKSFVCELQIIDDLDDKTTDFFDFCLNQICNLRTQNSLLNIHKEILLQKFFH